MRLPVFPRSKEMRKRLELNPQPKWVAELFFANKDYTTLKENLEENKNECERIYNSRFIYMNLGIITQRIISKDTGISLGIVNKTVKKC